MPSKAAAQTPADRELRWSARLRLAVDAGGEAEAREISWPVLADLSIPILGEPQYTQGGWDGGLSAPISTCHLYPRWSQTRSGRGSAT
jgi:hypothetical protein